jgi:hypothetical protein
MSWGTKSADLLRGFGLSRAVPGKRVYMTDESEARTWSAAVGPDGNLSYVKLFVEQGGKDGQTLFIAARTSLYAVRTRFKGRLSIRRPAARAGLGTR